MRAVPQPGIASVLELAQEEGAVQVAAWLSH